MTSIAQLHEAFLRCTGVCTDTRALAPGSLFVALRGPSFNANTFAAQALAGGCRHAMVDDPAVARDDRYLLVPDALKALQQLALHHRRRFAIPVVAITGTNGKTTTKELVHAVLAADRPTLATSGNLNNHIGVPLTLLRLTAEHRIAIIEMGANHVGDIAELMALAEPTHGLITNIGRAHLEGFGSYEGVVKAKTELVDFLRGHGGTLFVHADDPLLMTKSTGLARITYGMTATADHRVEAGPTGAMLALAWTGSDGARQQVTTRLIGGYNLPNAAAAVSIGRHFGVPDDRIAAALAAYTPSNNRSQFMDTGRNHLVLDAYNANPSSMKAALEHFATMPGERPKLAILGGMKELGANSRTEHEAVIALVRRLGLDAVYVGPEFTGLASSGSTAYADVNAALDAFRRNPVEGRSILVKGSRGTKLEALVPML
ncbi:MAG TPA: UDP-N-acetylmuramoyl-tripeptide--D-alanyl-D-alanine ligase [Flavobacteriales bacterium]|nr:UDP-N-acetylmuramoyl-tripeptide--D-alanyl-D-alanine ligase [Flavobacteriales bacterium]HMR26946.1 UDP-N-acetylmuramoyl-tripeptide--D-alanyl-D-alanine ligase [Flavobacteriales bacterium]